MASTARSSEIARAVRRLLARPSCAGHSSAPVIGPVARSAVMGGIALLTLAPGAATAVGLGEARPSSALGEPLRATVPMRLAAGEIARPGCVTAPVAKGDLRSPAGTRVRTPATTGPGVLELEVTTRQPLYEPLYELTLQVDCPGLPKVMRHYVLMLDLPGLALPANNGLAAGTPGLGTTRSSVRDTATPRSAPRRAASLAATRNPIPAGQRYRVREGDTLSTIAARVEGRAPNTTWQLADKIFAANPRAFIAGNPDLIKLGFEITIPVPGSVATPSNVPAPGEPLTPPGLVPPAETAARATSVEPAVDSAQQSLRQAKVATPASTLTTENAADATGTADSVSNPGAAAEPSQDFMLPPANSSPFADEGTVEGLDETAAKAIEPPPPLSFAPRASSQVSPLLAVLLGLLLGLGLCIVLLRSRLLEGLSRLFAGSRAERAVTPEQKDYADTDEWLKTEEGLHAEAFALGPPEEQTYIVEVEGSGSTAALPQEATAVDRTEDFDAPFAPPDHEYQPELDEMDTAEASGGARTAETVEMPGTAGPTMQMPGLGEAADAAATAETAAMPEADFDPTVEPDIAELFADDLSDLPGEPDLPVEIFAGIDEDTENSGLSPTAELPSFDDPGELFDDATVEAPGAGLDGLVSATDETEEMDLQGLGDEQQDEAQLSDTLQEALSLLERDFNEELTASQIVDQSALKRAISDHEGADDGTDMLQDPPTQKRAG